MQDVVLIKILQDSDIEFIRALRLHLTDEKVLKRFKLNVLMPYCHDEDRQIKPYVKKAKERPSMRNICELVKMRAIATFGADYSKDKPLSDFITSMVFFDWSHSPERHSFWSRTLCDDFRDNAKYKKFFSC